MCIGSTSAVNHWCLYDVQGHLTGLIYCLGEQACGNEKLETLKHMEEEVKEAENGAHKVEQEKEQKVHVNLLTWVLHAKYRVDSITWACSMPRTYLFCQTGLACHANTVSQSQSAIAFAAESVARPDAQIMASCMLFWMMHHRRCISM